MRALFASLFVLCAICPLAQSTPHNPRRTQNNNTQSQVSKPSEDEEIAKRPQPAVPPEINVSNNCYQDSGRDKGSDDGKTKDTSDFFLALFTLALVIVGILQWRVLRGHETWMQKNVEMVTRVADAADANTEAIKSQAITMNGQITAIEAQNGTMRESVAATKKIAEATQDSVEALIAKDRARIRIVVQPLKIVAGPQLVASWLENYGPTPAFVTEFRARFLHVPERDIVPDYKKGTLAIYGEPIKANETAGKGIAVVMEPVAP